MKSLLITLALLACFFSQTSFASPSLKQKHPIKHHRFDVKYNRHGLFVTRDDDAYSLNLYGYFESDFMAFANDHGMLNSGTNIRYATLYMIGTINRIWQYYLSYSVSMNALLDANIIYHGFHNQYIQVGQFTPNVGLSNWSRHLDLNFLEWALPVAAFSPGYPQGVHYDIYGKYFVGDASLFGGSNLSTHTKTNPVGATARIIFSPIHTQKRVLHFGISDWWQKPNDTHSVTFTSVPEVASHNFDALITTGAMSEVYFYNIISGEFAAVYGPWSFQTEYYLNNVHRKRRQSDVHFEGGYATIGYFLTGESRTYAYPLGAFTTVPEIYGKHGAFQVLARYSNLNLTYKNIRGGKEYNTTLGLNWFVNHFVTFKFNVIRAVADPASNGRRFAAMIYAARAQIQF